MQSFRFKGLLVALIGALSYIVSSAQVTSVPYFEGFEDPTQYSSWNITKLPTLSNYADNWRIDAGTSYAGSKSLYISDGTASVYQPSYSGGGLTLFCYQEFDLPAGNYDLSFAWKALGDGNDGLYVFWLPSNMNKNSYPSEIMAQDLNVAMNVDVDGTSTKVLNGSSRWKIATATVTSTGTRMRLYFAWSQNGQIETNPPACIDNVQIAKQSCKPSNINAIVNGSNVTISWTGTASSYELQYRTYGQSSFITKKNITSNSVTLSNLSEGVYDIMVRGICPPDTSVWVVKDNILIYDPLAHCLDFINLDAADCRSGSFSNPHQTPGKVDHGSTSIQSRHTVNQDANAYDAITNNQLPLIAPGEVVSIRLGNWDTGAEAESITYTYTIDSGAKQILILKYAIVLEDPNHGASEQPKFTLELLDENGRSLDQCGNVNFVASSTMAGNGWHRESSGSYSTIMWKEWTTTGVNLTPYAANGDRTIRIRLTTYDCSQSGHFGYAYFSLNCAEATISGISCGAVASASVSAPVGFDYEWTKATDTTTIVSRDKDLAVQSTDTSLYYCKVISQDNADCYFVLEANLLPNYPKARFVPKWTPKDCKNYVTLQNSSAIWTDRGETGKPCETFYWDYDNGMTSNDSGSPVIEIPDSGGTYNFKLVVGISEDQCQDSLIYTFTVPSIKPTRDTISAQICKGQIYPFDGKRLKTSGEYISNQQNAGGCDSITVLYLDVVSSVDTIMYDTICAGETYVLNGQGFTKTGTCQFTTKTQGGCDSIVTVHLYVHDPIEFKLDVKDEDEGPNTGQITPSDTLSTWTRFVNGVENGSLDSLKAGIYKIEYVNEHGCKGDTTIEVKRTCLKGNFGAVPLICADDSTFSVEFNVLDGSYSSYSLRFGADAKAAGFEDVDSIPNNGLIEIAVPENVRPDTYSVTVNFYDPTCGEHPEQLQFDVFYSNTIMAQKFNDVIALLNSKYNGGYEFTSYQWYKNGQPIPGAIKSYIYIGPNETFNISDSYSVAVVRAGESKSIMSCTLIPVTRTDVSPYLKMNVSGVRQHLPISPSEVNGEVIWWSISGQMVDRATVNAYDEYVVTPYQQGVYILELRFGDSRELYKVFIK